MSPRRSALTRPDRRYWRRRGNRKVRKARILKTLLRWSTLAVVNLLIAAVLVLAGLRAFDGVFRSSTFALEEIRVEGVGRSSARALDARLKPLIGGNVLTLDLGHVARLAADDPWVREASVKRILPDTLRVRVHERVPTAVAVINGLAHLVDREGFVIGPCGPRMADDLPVLTGLDQLEGRELAVVLRRGVRALARLRHTSAEWAGGISELDLWRSDRIVARRNGRGPIVLLDPDRVERNLLRYLALRPEIEERMGSASYVDLRWRDQISVMPAAGFSSARSR